MKKLIELGVAIDSAIDAADEYDGGYNFERDRKIRDSLMALPTVDAVPVVRCKDCKHCQYDSIFGSYWCGGRLGGIEIEADFFCKDGDAE